MSPACERCGNEMPGAHPLRQFCKTCKDRKKRERRKGSAAYREAHRRASQRRRARETASRPTYEKRCSECNSIFTTRHPLQVRCKRDCKAPLVKKCEACGTSFQASTKGRRYCTFECWPSSPKASKTVTCRDCGLVEDRRSSSHKRCRDCAAALNNERNIASYHANPTAHRLRIERSRRLMVKGSRKGYWTREEDLEVMRNDITTREIAILLDRDEAAVQRRRSRLRTKARNGALRKVCKGCGEAEVHHRSALCAGCRADGERNSARRGELRAYYVKKVASDIRVDDYGFAYKASTCLHCGGVAISRGVKARKFCSKACSRRGVTNASQSR